MVQKKTIKIGIAVLAVVALSIGLGVGISQSNKGNNAASSSSLVGGMDYSTYDDACNGVWSLSAEGGKSGKSGPTSPSEGKSGKSGPTAPSEGKARKLRNDMLRGKYLFIYYLSPSWRRRNTGIIILHQ
jgi:hypothetical protein